MKNRKIVICDKCQARFDYIPEKCPCCGETLLKRMDNRIREIIENKLKYSPFHKWMIVFYSTMAALYFIANFANETLQDNLLNPLPLVAIWGCIICTVTGLIFISIDRKSGEKTCLGIFHNTHGIHCSCRYYYTF
jgi:hypothetical protein